MLFVNISADLVAFWCLYLNAYESDAEKMTGGLVLEDGRTFQFVYQDGEISYEEEKND